LSNQDMVLFRGFRVLLVESTKLLMESTLSKYQKLRLFYQGQILKSTN
jgi:hypothetical protein